jgi:chemotaxis signal transduction protein
MSTPFTLATPVTRTHSVVLRLGERFCSIPVQNVREMTVIPKVESLCGVPPFIRGLCKLRGRSIPVFDLRERLGMPPLTDDHANLIAVLKQREKEHLKWIKELEASVIEERPFTLGTDPTACKFGKWTASFVPDTRELEHLLRGFDAPHAAIHGVALSVTRAAGNGSKEDALKIIDRTRATDLTFMLDQFQRVYSHLAQTPREIVVVAEVGEEVVGVVVDEVDSLAWITPETGDISRESSHLDSIYASVGKIEADGRMVSMLAIESLRIHK